MSTRYEWAHATGGFNLIDPDELDELADDGNEAREYGLSFSTGSNGCMIYGSLDELRDLGWKILAAVPHVEVRETATVTVKVENTYACGHESTSECDVRAPVPGEPLDEWWDGIVHPLTGDGHECGSTERALYVATVVRADDPELAAGDSRTWEG